MSDGADRQRHPDHAPSCSIGFVLTPGMLTTGTALPYEMWLAAMDCRRSQRAAANGCRLWLVAAGGGARGRLPLTPDCDIAQCPPLDIVYLPALWRDPERVMRLVGDELSPWLRTLDRRGARLAAVSTGVALLAASGLLDGRAATTHWVYFDRFARTFPEVRLKREFFITQSGNRYCAASINSLADVTVHLIERFFDRATAHHVERNFSHEIRRSYEAYRYLDGGTSPVPDEIAAAAQSWIEADPAADISVAQLAARLGVPRRTLDRRFRDATGISVRRYWQNERVRMAKELLERTDLPIGDIAWRVGYGDAGHFTRLFRRELSVTPRDYRRTIRAKLFAPALNDAAVKNVDARV